MQGSVVRLTSSLRPEAAIGVEAFVRVCLAHGFHAISCATFKEMGAEIKSAASAISAVSAFTRKLPTLGKKAPPKASRQPSSDKESSPKSKVEE